MDGRLEREVLSQSRERWNEQSNFNQKGGIRLETLKFFIAVFIVILTISCSREGDKMKVIAYGTPEFNMFVKNVKISPQEAWDIQLEYYKNNKMKTIGVPLFFIINDKYLFTPYYNPKIPEVTIKGVAVDSKNRFC
jgi:hypothetical protein